MSLDLPTLAVLQSLGPTRAAAFWLERLDREASESEERLFRDWLTSDPANQEAWDRALELWDSFDAADGDAGLDAMRQEARKFPPRHSTSRTWLRYAVAASVVIIAASAIMLNIGRFGSAPTKSDGAGAQQASLIRSEHGNYSTAVGQTRIVALNDGTKITLDTDTAVDVAYIPGQRVVKLIRGQAFFDVAHDKSRPFRVAAGDRVVSVFGTRFNMRYSEADTRVLLVQGSIGVSKGSDPSRPAAEIERLVPGQQLIARAGQPDEISQVDVEMGVDWTKGFVQFDKQTLAEAVEELNRYTDKKLVVRDPKVAALRISGAFPTGDTDRFVQPLTALYPVRVRPTADGKLEIVRRR